MKRYHLLRLLRLADKLDGTGPYASVGPVPVKKFELDFFYNAGRGDYWHISMDEFSPTDCGTTACAVGWAAADRWFASKLPLPQRESDLGEWSAELFGIAEDADNPAEWLHLFHKRTYPARRNPTPRDVSRRIRSYVKRKALELNINLPA